MSTGIAVAEAELRALEKIVANHAASLANPQSSLDAALSDIRTAESLFLIAPDQLAEAVRHAEAEENIVPTGKVVRSQALEQIYQQHTEETEMNEELQSLMDDINEAYENNDTELLDYLMETWRSKKRILMGAHRSRVQFHGGSSDGRSKLRTGHRRFDTLVAEPQKKFSRLVSQGSLHSEGVEIYTEDMDQFRLSEDAQFRMRSIIAQKQKQREDEEREDDEARGISRAKKVLNVRNRIQGEGKAADTIRGHGRPSDESVATMVATDHSPPAIRVGEIDTKSALSGWRAEGGRRPVKSEVIEKSVDNSFVAQAKRTRAASTIARPVASKAGFKSNADNDQGEQPYNQTARAISDVASKMGGADTYTPAGQKKSAQRQYDVDNRNLSSNRDGNQPPLSNR